MKYLKVLLSAALALGATNVSQAVTDGEMEQARATAAQIYLRWANNGSDYLERLTPTTLAELEKSLKDTEKKNIASFKAVAVPRDYARWDKAALVKYWSSTFFESAGLNADGARQGARNQIKKKLEKMTVSAPAPAEEKPAAEAPQPADTAAGQGTPDALALQQAQQEAELAAKTAQADSISAALAAADEESAAAKESSSSTWIYIVVLVVLVAAVIWLVVFASKTLKKSDDVAGGERPEGRRREETPSEPEAETARTAHEDAPYVRPAVADESARMREKFAQTLAAKTEEIRVLNRRLQDMSAEADSLSAEAASLREENMRLRQEMERLRAATEAAPAPRPTAAAPAPAPAQPAVAPAAQQPREIFLGRVNSRGIFVRADRLLNPGATMYSLLTSDGYSGSFRVVTDPDSIQAALDNPEEWLSAGCVAKDLTDTAGRSGIVTESAGTAIFENGTWRVIRKARVRYV